MACGGSIFVSRLDSWIDRMTDEEVRAMEKKLGIELRNNKKINAQ
jgi:hypothetical protein